MQEKIVLYSFRRCPFAMRVRLTLHEKGIPFNVVEEDLKNFSEQLRSLHPEAKVPVLVHGSFVIYESAIINEYLNDLDPEHVPLMPQAAEEKAKVRLLTYWCNQVFKTDVDRLKYGETRFTKTECDGVENRLTTHLGKLEERLAVGPWLVSEKITLADLNLFPFVRQLSRVTPRPVMFDHFPSVIKWMERILERPSFKATMAK